MGLKSITFSLCLVALIAAPELSFGKEIPLQKRELRNLYIDNTLTLEHKGRETLQYTAPGGEVVQQISPDERKFGSWTIKGSRNPRICYSFPGDESKCYIALKDELSNVVNIYRYKNKRAGKLVYRVIDGERGNQIFTPAALSDAPLDLTRTEIRQVQAALNKRGFNAGPADGVMGGKTRDAIEDFQVFIDQTPTGELTEDQLDRLLN